MPYDFGLNDQQRLLITEAQRIAEERLPFEISRRANDQGIDHMVPIWKGLGELGWASFGAPESAGGVALGLVDVVLVANELGKRAALLPFVPHNVALVHLGQVGAPIDAALLDGSSAIAVADAEASDATAWALSTTITPTAGGARVTGSKFFVAYATIASHFLVTGRTPSGDLATVLVPAGAATLHPYPGTARDGRARVDFDAEVAGATVSTVSREQLQGLRDLYRIGAAAVINGAARAALDLTVEYAKMRTIFGRPLGTFQAVQHRCVDMLFDAEACHWLTVEAAWRFDSGLPDDGAIAAACAYVVPAAQRIAAHAHQVHGAIGFTWEHDLPFLTSTIKGLVPDLGKVQSSLESLGATIGINQPALV